MHYTSGMKEVSMSAQIAPNRQDDEWTTAEAAAWLHVSPQRVRQYIRDGRLAARKRGRDFFVIARDVALLPPRRTGRPRSRDNERKG